MCRYTSRLPNGKLFGRVGRTVYKRPVRTGWNRHTWSEHGRVMALCNPSGWTLSSFKYKHMVQQKVLVLEIVQGSVRKRNRFDDSVIGQVNHGVLCYDIGKYRTSCLTLRSCCRSSVCSPVPCHWRCTACRFQVVAKWNRQDGSCWANAPCRPH